MKNKEVRFEFPGIPPSSNHAIGVARNGMRFANAGLKAWQKLVRSHEIQKIVDSEWYGIELFFYFPLYYKNGKVKRADRGNLVKYAEDEVAKRLITYNGDTIDDKLFRTATSEKIDSEEIKTVVIVYAI